MIDWTSIKDEIETWLNLSGVGVLDELDGETFPVEDAIIRYSIQSIVGVGIDEKRIALNNDPIPEPNVEVRMHGRREFTLSIRCESFDVGIDKQAFGRLELLRSKLKTPSVLKRFQDIGVAVVQIFSINTLSSFSDRRVTSSANMDVLFAAVSVEKDVVDANTIETATVRAKLRQPDVELEDATITFETEI